MFEKTLTDVVRGIRASKRDTALYISQCIAEIKTEINSSDMFVKANALQKLTFLQMMGYSMSWASFATIEVMSSPRFAHKRIGYLAASQGFTQDTEVILLTTNLLKKELRGAIGGSMSGVYEAGLAINCISNIVTEDLARDLLPEVTNLTSHPQPYLRKKAILCLFKLFVKYPQALRLTFAKLQACLDDSNASVVSCAVNVITELSDKNPKNYLHLAPAFFDLLTKSSNNWMLIKVVKLLGSLVPEEPRLARKLLEPLSAIVRNTQAKSLLYEAVHTITLCLPYCRKSDGTMPPIVPEIVTLCAQTLRSFVEETDQNLKYLGLVGFGSLMKSHPRVLSAPDYRPLILACLSDDDVTIRTRALDLLTGMASRKNLMELVTQLLQHVELASGSYKHDLVAKIIEMCCGEKYALLQDFEWYLDILVIQLGHMRGIEKHADLLRAQITDVALRVLPVRAFAVQRSIEILLERDGRPRGEGAGSSENNNLSGDNGRGKQVMPEILPAAAWIVGEYSDLIPEAIEMEEEENEDDEKDKKRLLYDQKSTGRYHSIIQALTAPMNVRWLPTSTQKVYIQDACKVLSAAAAADPDVVKSNELEACAHTIRSNLPVYMQSTDPEVVERSFTAYELLRSLGFVGSANSISGILTTASDDFEESDKGGDLLGMVGGTGVTKSRSESKSLASDIRNASGVLNYLLKPSPMKPVGAKAQRKKRSSPNGVTVDLDAPVDLSVFEDFIAEEEIYRTNTKLSIEAVTFTQQRPLQIEEAVFTSLSSGPALDTPSFMTTQPSPFVNSNSASTSFQNRPVTGTVATSPTRPRQGDPFYLDSGPAVEVEESKTDSRFGTIQLLDSDEEQEGKKKQRKKKKEKKPKSHPPVAVEAPSADSLLSFTASAAPVPSMGGSRPTSTIIYESDDEDDQDDDDMFMGRSKRTSKEFAGLAKVDLTTPLREDEVMPERKHRVVPERPRQEPITSTKPKKKSKKSKKSSKIEESPLTDAVGDLLDLGGFTPVPAPAPMAAPMPVISATPAPAPALLEPMMTSTNPINTAFDDLLGLSAPAPAPKLGGIDILQSTLPSTGAPPLSTSKKSAKRPWMRASIKLSGASGSSSADWSRVVLLFRVYRTIQEGPVAASVVFRFENKGSTDISDLSLDIKGYGNHVIGSAGPGSSLETTKIGPFTFSTADSNLSMKGSLRSAGYIVPVKFSLPASVYLEPVANLSIEQVAQEFSSGGWSSHMCKIDVVSGLQPDNIKLMLCGFFHAEEVLDGSGNPMATTLAARSTLSGSPVRVLVKIKERSVKIDLKCTNPTLGDALASDLRHVIL